MYRFWTQNECEYLKQNYDILPVNQIAKTLDRTVDSVKVKAQKMKLKKTHKIFDKPHPFAWPQEDVNLLKKLYADTPTKEICSILNRSYKSVTMKAKKLKLRKNGKPGFTRDPSRNLYKMNRAFFEKLAPEAAYVIGFFVADGNMSSTIDRFSISNNNLAVLEKMRDAMGSNHPIYIEENVPPKQTSYCLTVASQKVTRDLFSFGVTPKKSLTATLPNLDDELFSHFLRGYFDGDGYARYGHREGLIIKFTSGSYWLLRQLADKLTSLYSLSEKKVTCDKDKNAAFRLHYFGPEALNIADIMYSNAGALYIERKKQVFENYRNRPVYEPKSKHGPVCSVEGCTRPNAPHYAMCWSHENRRRRYGDPLKGKYNLPLLQK